MLDFHDARPHTAAHGGLRRRGWGGECRGRRRVPVIRAGSQGGKSASSGGVGGELRQIGWQAPLASVAARLAALVRTTNCGLHPGDTTNLVFSASHVDLRRHHSHPGRGLVLLIRRRVVMHHAESSDLLGVGRLLHERRHGC